MYTFPKSARLLKAAEYTAVFRAPDINLSTGPLRIRARKTRMPTARLGLVVTKKGNPRANRRNRIKRIIRDSFRHMAPGLPNVDIVVQVFDPLDDQRLRSVLLKQFERIRSELGDKPSVQTDSPNSLA